MPTHDLKKSDLTAFFTRTLWHMDHRLYPGPKGKGLKYLQIMALVVRDFLEDQCPLRASALAFTTILSLVPLFALAFSVLKGLGVQNRVEPFILQQVAAGSEQVVQRIVTYINNTNMTSLGTIGLLTLIVTAITLLGNVEQTFNIIWGVRETRSLHRKFSDYLSVLVSTPFLMLTAMSVSTSLLSQNVVRWLITNTYLGEVIVYAIRFIQHLSVWMALVVLYIFIPNTKVRLKSAVIGGILAGTVWQVVQWGYINFQVGVAKYNAIYGTLAVLPIFMVWIYTSWIVVLFGVEMVYAHQNIGTFLRELRGSVNYGTKELLVLAVLQEIAGTFHMGHHPKTLEELAQLLDVPVKVVRELADLLRRGGFVTEIAGDVPAYQPARDAKSITVKEVLDAMKRYGGEMEIEPRTDGEKLLQSILDKADAAVADALSGMTLKDLIATPETKPVTRNQKPETTN